jgi:hypothetical protein
MTTEEPAKPERGLTAEERGRDISESQAEVEQEESWSKRALQSIAPRFYFGQADGYPGPVKWFLWFCLALIWPAWIFTVLVYIPIGYVGYGILWVLFAPIRMREKRKNPEGYAAVMEKHAKKKG